MDRHHSIFQLTLIGLIKLYRLTISPLLRSRCRYFPSCSVYSIEAIQQWGSLKGFFLALKRVLRCHPYGHQGYDPVPLVSAASETSDTHETSNTHHRCCNMNTVNTN